MKFTITDKDNNTQVAEYDLIDVPAVNRRGVSKFQYGGVSLDIESGVFEFNGLKMPFNFDGDNEFILFRRVQQVFDSNANVVSENSVVVFGIRNTRKLEDGSLKNNVQLIWCYPESIKIGGNK